MKKRIIQKLFRCTAVFLLVGWRSVLLADSPLILNEGRGEMPLGLHLELLEDPSKQWSIEDVMSAEMSRKFVASKVEIPNLGLSKSAWWARFQLNNPSAKTQVRLLEIPFSFMESIDLFVLHENWEIESISSGHRFPFKERPLQNRNFVLPLELRPNSKTNVYLRVSTDNRLFLPLILWNKEEFSNKTKLDLYSLGFYYGALGIMLIFNLFIFIMMRDRTHLDYALFLLARGFFYFSLNGFAFMLLWPKSPWLHSISPSLTACATVYFALQITQSFLGTKRFTPILHRLMNWNKIAAVLFAIQILFPFFKPLIPLTLVLSIICTLLLLFGSVEYILRGYRPALLFLLARLFPFLGITILFLSMLDIIPTYLPGTIELLQFSSLLEFILILLALVQRMHLSHIEKDIALDQVLSSQQRAQLLEKELSINTTQSQELLARFSEYMKDTQRWMRKQNPDQQGMRQALVELHQLSLLCWEESSGKSKLELVQQSQLWNANLDQRTGTWRMRGFDQYLDLTTLPKNPRWRSVVKTANFVLESCPAEFKKRNELKERTENLINDFQ
ncbi:MAG: hypothetical protein H8E38_11675 [SAR324 cluster bacterium]|nr:hypothetical protein [SAR324 cluster bacterium]MBL7035553.1 hypothetical protein [SAR324 cluster bacterium]